MEYIAIIGAIVGVIGLFGWSHKSLAVKIDRLEKDMLKRPNNSEVRTLVSDKLEPYEISYRSLSYRIEELKANQNSLDAKVDRLIEICSKLEHK